MSFNNPFATYTPVQSHIDAARTIVKEREEELFCKERHQLNVLARPKEFSRDQFWFRVVGCICTSMQNSGPESPLNRFLREEPFSLDLRHAKLARI